MRAYHHPHTQHPQPPRIHTTPATHQSLPTSASSRSLSQASVRMSTMVTSSGAELPSQRATLAKDERWRPRRPAGLAARARRVSAARCVYFVRAARSVVVCGRRVTSCLSVAGIVRDHMMEALAKIDAEVAAAQTRAASDRVPAIVTTTAAGAGAGGALAGAGAGAGGAGAGVASATSAPPECAVRIADAATFAEVVVTSRFEALGVAVHCLMLQAGFVCTGHDIVDRAVPGFAPPLRGAILWRRRAFVHVNCDL
jgi:hypothetical protein